MPERLSTWQSLQAALRGRGVSDRRGGAAGSRITENRMEVIALERDFFRKNRSSKAMESGRSSKN